MNRVGLCRMSVLRFCLASHLVSEALGFSPVSLFQSLPNQRPGHVCTKTNGFALNAPGTLSHSFSKGVFHKGRNNEPLSRLRSSDAATVAAIPVIPKPALLIPAERYSSGEWLKSLIKLPRSFTLRRVNLDKTAAAGLTVFNVAIDMFHFEGEILIQPFHPTNKLAF